MENLLSALCSLLSAFCSLPSPLTPLIGRDSIRKTFNTTSLADAPEVAVDMVKKSSQTTKGKRARPVFEGIRKPLAPPGHPMTHAKPEEKARPAGRKAKHKRKPEEVSVLEDIE